MHSVTTQTNFRQPHPCRHFSTSMASNLIRSAEKLLKALSEGRDLDEGILREATTEASGASVERGCGKTRNSAGDVPAQISADERHVVKAARDRCYEYLMCFDTTSECPAAINLHLNYLVGRVEEESLPGDWHRRRTDARAEAADALHLV
jgi:hypothetical protein